MKSRKTQPPSYIVGIGGSAGALNAYKALLDALPLRTGMAFVIISHMNPTASSDLAKILTRHTNMPVLVTSTTMPILRDYVYIISPDTDLYVEAHSFVVVSPRVRRNTQVDIFFTSLAAAMGTHAIGIILSGYDGDGSKGCEQIKANGGMTFAQDASVEVKHMPLSAMATGCVDFVLPVAEIAKRLVKISKISHSKIKVHARA
jgi:two-component system CheB/CheR fusion protein